MADSFISREFLLAAACCRRPLSDRATAAIREAAHGEVEWPLFLRLARRHRVEGLVHEALTAVAVPAVPQEVRSALAARARQVAQCNLSLAAETMRLQAAFGEAGIPMLVLKGVPLAQLAYGTQAVKQGRDIDFLVPPDFAMRGFRLLEKLGYRFFLPARQLSEAQRHGLVRYGNEAEFLHHTPPLRADLHWQPAYNPALLKGIGAHSPSQAVAVPGFGTVRTLSDPDLFAYLCVHGAGHRWSRLKWLADLNALISAESGRDIVALYRHAREKGAALCAAQGLLLAHRLFALELPPALLQELNADGRACRLTTMALRAMSAARSRNYGPFGDFFLGRGPAFLAAQWRVICIGLPDVILLPLPWPLHFLYPLFRLPLSVWRRAKRASVRATAKNGS
jgi:hypothetical protein